MKYTELIRKLKRNGWIEIRQSGGHIMKQHPDKSGIQLTVPNHSNREIGKGLQKKIMKQAGIK